MRYNKFIFNKTHLLIFCVFNLGYGLQYTALSAGLPTTSKNDDSNFNNIYQKDPRAALKSTVSSEVELSYKLPNSVEPFENQVAGHVFIKKKDTMGMMKKDKYVLKPVPHSGPDEINFYEALENTSDPLLLELKKYVPKYTGTVNIEIEGKDVTCLRMEDITNDMKSPCVMDIKLGIKTWGPDSPKEKIERKKKRFVEMKKRWGFTILGFRYHNVKNGSSTRHGKDYTKLMNPDEVIEVMYEFVNGKVGMKYGLVDEILTQLHKIHSWFERQRKFLFFSTSVLITYDMEKLRVLMEKDEAVSRSRPTDEYQYIASRETIDDHSKIVKVYLIDFAHALPNESKEADTNCIDSLKKLIYIFENLNEFYEQQSKPTHCSVLK